MTPAFTVSLMHDIARFIAAHCTESLTLAQLAAEAQMSPSHMQRQFTKIIGISPKAYHAACRLQAFKAGLGHAPSVTSAIYDAGFGAVSRVYGALDAQLGMTPKQYRAQGANLAISYASAPTTLGILLLGATDRGLCFLQFGDDATALQDALAREYPRARLTPSLCYGPAFAAWMQALKQYLAGAPQNFSLPLDLKGTAFQWKVWRYLQTIPAGRTKSYREVAHALGAPAAARAVARACATNPAWVVIPCHRVIRGDGGLGGYRGGLARKEHLLALERGPTLKA